jgi:hypothetical protein
MCDTEKLRLKNALIVCAELFNRTLSEGVLKIYITSLKDYSIEKVIAALNLCVQELSYMPTIADILKRVNNKVDLSEAAELAWSYVLDVIDVCGIYESFTFKDKTIRKTLSLIDYDVELCMCNRSELHWKKRDFIESYKAFAGLNGDYDAPNYFAGVIELNNGDKYKEISATKIYIAEDKAFVGLEELNRLIEGYKPKLKLVKKIQKLIGT